MGVVGGATVVGGARARKVALDLADSRFHLFRMMMKTNDHDEDTGGMIFCRGTSPQTGRVFLEMFNISAEVLKGTFYVKESIQRRRITESPHCPQPSGAPGGSTSLLGWAK